MDTTVWPDVAGKVWAAKAATEMTDAEVLDAVDTYHRCGRHDYEDEWLRRSCLPQA